MFRCLFICRVTRIDSGVLDTNLLFSKYFPTVEKCVRSSSANEYIPWPQQEEVGSALMRSLSVDINHRHYDESTDSCEIDESKPVFTVTTSKGDLWPFVVIEKAGILFCCLVALETHTKTRPEILDVPSVAHALVFLENLAAFLGDVPRSEAKTSNVISTANDFLSVSCPFGEPLSADLDFIRQVLSGQSLTIPKSSDTTVPPWRAATGTDAASVTTSSLDKKPRHGRVSLRLSETVRCVQHDQLPLRHTTQVSGCLQCRLEEPQRSTAAPSPPGCDQASVGDDLSVTLSLRHGGGGGAVPRPGDWLESPSCHVVTVAAAVTGGAETTGGCGGVTVRAVPPLMATAVTGPVASAQTPSTAGNNEALLLYTPLLSYRVDNDTDSLQPPVFLTLQVAPAPYQPTSEASTDNYSGATLLNFSLDLVLNVAWLEGWVSRRRSTPGVAAGSGRPPASTGGGAVSDAAAIAITQLAVRLNILSADLAHQQGCAGGTGAALRLRAVAPNSIAGALIDNPADLARGSSSAATALLGATVGAALRQAAGGSNQSVGAVSGCAGASAHILPGCTSLPAAGGAQPVVRLLRDRATLEWCPLGDSGAHLEGGGGATRKQQRRGGAGATSSAAGGGLPGLATLLADGAHLRGSIWCYHRRTAAARTDDGIAASGLDAGVPACGTLHMVTKNTTYSRMLINAKSVQCGSDKMQKVIEHETRSADFKVWNSLCDAPAVYEPPELPLSTA